MVLRYTVLASMIAYTVKHHGVIIAVNQGVNSRYHTFTCTYCTSVGGKCVYSKIKTVYVIAGIA